MRIANARARSLRPALTVTAATLLFAVTGCGLDKPANPNLSGPSDLGVSTELIAAPDVLNADGVSQAVIHLVLRDKNGSPLSGLSVLFQHDGDGYIAPSAASNFVGPVQTGLVMSTASDGSANVVYVAGKATGTVTFFVRPYGIDSTFTWERTVQIVQR